MSGRLGEQLNFLVAAAQSLEENFFVQFFICVVFQDEKPRGNKEDEVLVHREAAA